METVLIIFLLNIQSSYVQNIETVAVKDSADTIQFFLQPDNGWRIKTFAVDQDVHVYSLGITNGLVEEKVIASTERSYGDVIAKKYIIRSETGVEGIKAKLKAINLSESIEVSRNGFSFWVPENSNYRTQSSPE